MQQVKAQPSTGDVALPDSSYIFLQKGNTNTRKFSKSFNKTTVELPTGPVRSSKTSTNMRFSC